MSKYCVILASHIPSKSHIWVGEDILKKVKEHLVDVDIFVGINPSDCVDEWVDVVKKYTNNYSITEDRLTVGSEASAYQTALKLYSENVKDYELVWFLHTQGTKSGRHEVRNYHLTNLVTNKNDVLNFFKNKNNGGYSSNYSPAPWINSETQVPIESVLDKYYNFKYKAFRFISTGTMYVISGKILNEFIINTDKSFFNEPLTVYDNQVNTDLYFFERDFINIVSKMGYIIGAYRYQNDYGLNLGDVNTLYKNYLNKWITENKIIKI
jgi:hypothetical protein